MAEGIQHGPAARLIRRHEPGEILAVLERSKFESTTRNPNRLSGPEILGLPLLETSNLLPNTEFFSSHVPDYSSGRGSWFNSLLKQSQGTDFVFLDPDNGLEVKSKPYGRKNSSKFLYWHEVEVLWRLRKSLLVYQYFIRENRGEFVQRILNTLSEATPGSLVEAFSTPHVVFLMALQPEHQHLHEQITDAVQQNWKGQIRHWDLIASN
jgi:hypothetical protein